ncbi:putative membrane protein [Synechococcus sp. A15-24]|nr:putative membrane protein [Synechococcus sp. A15-24]
MSWVTTRVPNHIVMARQLTSIGLLGAAIVALYGFALINSFRG